MNKEDQLLVKSLVFAASGVFAILSVVTLIFAFSDFNAIKDSSSTLQGANLSPLLVVFLVVAIATLIFAISCFAITFSRTVHAKEWLYRMRIISIIMLVLTLALFTIMKVCSYMSFESISAAIKDSSNVDELSKKFFTSQFANAMIFSCLSSVVNIFFIHMINNDTVPQGAPSVVTNYGAIQNLPKTESQILQEKIEAAKEAIHVKELQKELDNLTAQLSVAEPEQSQQLDINDIANTSEADDAQITVDDLPKAD